MARGASPVLRSPTRRPPSPARSPFCPGSVLAAPARSRVQAPLLRPRGLADRGGGLSSAAGRTSAVGRQLRARARRGQGDQTVPLSEGRKSAREEVTPGGRAAAAQTERRMCAPTQAPGLQGPRAGGRRGSPGPSAPLGRRLHVPRHIRDRPQCFLVGS